MNLILITTGKRPELLRQSLDSMVENAGEWEKHHLTVVVDGGAKIIEPELSPADAIIVLPISQGASAARNIGASSIPKYRRHSHVCFFDDDIWLAPGWDEKFLFMWNGLNGKYITSLYGHPFNHEDDHFVDYAKFPLLVSSVCTAMEWSAWDIVGPWTEPGGPGGSEDYALCMMAKSHGYSFAVSNPHALIHTGMMSSNGQFIVGYKELAEQNERLLDYYGVKGKVRFA